MLVKLIKLTKLRSVLIRLSGASVLIYLMGRNIRTYIRNLIYLIRLNLVFLTRLAGAAVPIYLIGNKLQ